MKGEEGQCHLFLPPVFNLKLQVEFITIMVGNEELGDAFLT